jgi:NAD(P)H-hydrate epimerase
MCGKGNNGGDGFVIARQLHTRIHPRDLHVLLAADPEQLKGDAAENYRMLRACGCPVAFEITAAMRHATLVIDALLGTGLAGPAHGRMLDLIREINTGFPNARVAAVDVPSGMLSDAADQNGEIARADLTVTFTAAKPAQALPPNCDRTGKLIVGHIGSPPELIQSRVTVSEPSAFRHLFAPRGRATHKGDFGHVLVIGGSRGKTGAAAMAGVAALRSGAGLVTVATAASALPVIAAHAAELMTDALAETACGAISAVPETTFERKTLAALGPGLGTHADTVAWVRDLAATCPLPMVIDADGLNALPLPFPPFAHIRVLTPHPGEMARLAGVSTREVLADRVKLACRFASERNAILILKGQRSLIAFPDGRLVINPTGSPAMATGGSGDILTGMLAGLMAQFPRDIESAIAAAVYLHGRSGELGAAELGEMPLTATDLLRYLPAAIHEVSRPL